MYVLVTKDSNDKVRGDKLNIFFEEEFDECNTTDRSHRCPTHWWNFMCLSMTDLNVSNIKLTCQFYKTESYAKCLDNGLWNVTSSQLFDDCFGREHNYRARVISSIYIYLYPVMVFIFITSVFKLFEYNEISREYHWKVIIWVLILKSVSLSTRFLMAIVNSSFLIYQLCMLLMMISFYCDFFAITCMFSECFYVYAVLHYIEIQMRIIKSALKHIAFVSPVVILIVGLIIDVTFDSRRMFQCREEPILSPITFLYVYLGIAVCTAMFYMRMKNRYRVISANIYDNSINAYRVEYDVLGRRKEVSYRDIVRLIYVTNMIMITTCVNIFVNAITMFSQFSDITSGYSRFSVFVYPCNDLVFVFLALSTVWFNPTLKCLVKALQRWYKEVDQYEAVDKNVSVELFASLKASDQISRSDSDDSNISVPKWP